MENTVWQEWHDRVNVAVEEAAAFSNAQQREHYAAAVAQWEVAAKQAKGTNQPLPAKPKPFQQVIAVKYDAGIYAGLLYININGPMEPEIISQFEKDQSAPPPVAGKVVVGVYWFKDLDGSVYYMEGSGDTAALGQEGVAEDGAKVKKVMVPQRPFGRLEGYVKVA